MITQAKKKCHVRAVARSRPDGSVAQCGKATKLVVPFGDCDTPMKPVVSKRVPAISIQPVGLRQGGEAPVSSHSCSRWSTDPASPQ